jgi:hypothetical protein
MSSDIGPFANSHHNAPATSMQAEATAPSPMPKPRIHRLWISHTSRAAKRFAIRHHSAGLTVLRHRAAKADSARFNSTGQRAAEPESRPLPPAVRRASARRCRCSPASALRKLPTLGLLFSAAIPYRTPPIRFVTQKLEAGTSCIPTTLQRSSCNLSHCGLTDSPR